MAEHLRIPLLIDALFVSAPGEIVSLQDHPALDRAFDRRGGPLLNRVVLGRARRVLRTRGGPLPSAQPRGDEARRRAQQTLAARLDPDAAPWDEATLDALAACLRGDGSRDMGEAAQEAIGRLFVKRYRADEASWRDARLLDEALNSNNPLKRIRWALSGAVANAQRRLSARAGGDAAAVHATGIAVHSFLRALERLREGAAAPGVTRRAALGRAATAPENVLRVVTEPAEILGAQLKPGALVVFRTRAAAERMLDRRLSFFSGSWSQCPAHRLVPAMLAEILARAGRAPQQAREG